VERVLYRVFGVDEKEEMSWKSYASSLVIFNVIMEVFGLMIIPVAFPFTLGAMLINRRQGWAIYASMMILFLANFHLYFDA
jgi:K+-transporting ATPase A subunit